MIVTHTQFNEYLTSDDHVLFLFLWGWGEGTISVARGGGGRQLPPPPPNNAFSEFCRYIWKFVGTCKPTSMSFVPTKYMMYRQNIERNSSL